MTVGIHRVQYFPPGAAAAPPGPNLLPNPVMAVDASGWFAYDNANHNATPARVTGRTGYAGGITTALRATFHGAITVAGDSGFYSGVHEVEAGTPYVGRMQVQVSKAQRLSLNLDWYDNSTDWTYLGSTWGGESTQVVLQPNVVTDLTVTASPPPGAGVVSLSVYTEAGTGFVPWAANDWVEGTNAYVGSAVTPLGCDVLTVDIHHGRDDPTSQPEASTASMTLVDAIPDGLDIGSTIVVDTSLDDGATWLRRFAGQVTDLGAAWELGYTVDQPEGGVAPRSAVIAAGPLAVLGRRVIGDVPWPQELDGARVNRILAGTGVPLGVMDPGTVNVLARDVDRQPALDVATETATDGAGVVWETRDGLVAYADADHRRSAAITLVLDACDVLLTPQWSRTKSGLVNSVALGYGDVPEGGTQPVVTAVRTDSVAKFGTYAYSQSTRLAAVADAQQRANLLVNRGGYPVWNLSSLPLDVALLDAAQTAALLALDMHDLLGFTGWPESSPESAASLWIEGWAEHLEWQRHTMALSVSAYCRTAPAPHWDEAPPTWTWDSMADPPRTWDDAQCLGQPLPTFGRWDDVPAGTHWDTVPAETDWDEWKD